MWRPSSPAEPKGVVQVGGSTSKRDDDLHRLEQMSSTMIGRNLREEERKKGENFFPVLHSFLFEIIFKKK